MKTTDDPNTVIVRQERRTSFLAADDTEFRLGRLFSNRSDVKLYYISDLHIDYHAYAAGVDFDDHHSIFTFVSSVVDQLIESASSSMSGGSLWDHVSDVILIGGDVANDLYFAAVFYWTLSNSWPGAVVGVLGNHELWNFKPSHDNKQLNNVIDECRSFIISDMPDNFKNGRFLLENDLLVFGEKPELYHEADVLAMSDTQLFELLATSSFAILGGMGWAGGNQEFNAEANIYQGTVYRSQEISRSDRFVSVYNRVLSAGGDQDVIVLTHMPVRDWLGVDSFNRGWVYVNGHTHRNGLVIDDGRCVLFDNQIGYKTSRYLLQSFTMQGFTDPFSLFADGRYVVTEADYVHFLRSRGVVIAGCGWPGEILLLKRGNVHMFFLQGKKRMSLLRGGRRIRIDHDLDYYWDHMQRYSSILCEAFFSYRSLLEQLSREIKAFGGSGKVHGSIVDIDYYHHVSIDPRSGEVTVYFAYDMNSRTILPDVRVAITRAIPQHSVRYNYDDGIEPVTGSELADQQKPYKEALAVYDRGVDKGLFPLLSRIAKGGGMGTFVDDSDVSRVALYGRSNVMLSIQRLLDVGVIQVWNDQVLSFGTRAISATQGGSDSAILCH